jgi:hypothetical protein
MLYARWQRSSYGYENSPRRRLYQCRVCGGTSIDGVRLDEYVITACLNRWQSPDAQGIFDPPTNDTEIEAADDEVGALERRLQGFRVAGAKGDLSPEGLVAVEQSLLPDLDAARKRADKLKPQRAPALAGVTAASIVAGWDGFDVARRRLYINATCELVVGRATPGLQRFDLGRLAGSKWRGDSKTWGEMWAANPPAATA